MEMETQILFQADLISAEAGLHSLCSLQIKRMDWTLPSDQFENEFHLCSQVEPCYDTSRGALPSTQWQVAALHGATDLLYLVPLAPGLPWLHKM